MTYDELREMGLPFTAVLFERGAGKRRTPAKATRADAEDTPKPS